MNSLLLHSNISFILRHMKLKFIVKCYQKSATFSFLSHCACSCALALDCPNGSKTVCFDAVSEVGFVLEETNAQVRSTRCT